MPETTHRTPFSTDHRPLALLRTQPGPTRPQAVVDTTPVMCIRPPYRVAEPLACLREPLAGGSVLALRFPGDPAQDEAVRDAALSLRARFPTTALVLWVDAVEPGAVHALTRASGLRIPVLLADHAPLEVSVRRALTPALDLGGQVTDWLRARGVRLSPALAYLVREIFSEAHRYSRVADLLKAVGEAETTARLRFRRRKLPSPGAWFRAARALHAALCIQARPERALLQISHDLGYCDHSALSQQFARTFHLRPGEVRDRLGWEWILHRWLAHRLAVHVNN